jgi:lipase
MQIEPQMMSGLPELRRVMLESPGQAEPGIEMEYLDYGGRGSPVVLLHATGFLPWLWHPIAAGIAQDHRIIAPCLYSHRPSDPHAGGLGWLLLAEDIQRLCLRLKIENPIFVGHSMGATIAILTHTVHHKAAAGLILIEPILLPRDAYRMPLPLEQHPLAARAIRRRNHWPDREAVWNDFKTKVFFQSWDPSMLSLYIRFGTCENEMGAVTLACSPLQEAALFMGGMQHDPWPELKRIKCPVWVVEGETSENRSWIDLQQVAGWIPESRYIQVPHAGHLVPMEKPQETLRLIRSFLKLHRK